MNELTSERLRLLDRTVESATRVATGYAGFTLLDAPDAAPLLVIASGTGVGTLVELWPVESEAELRHLLDVVVPDELRDRGAAAAALILPTVSDETEADELLVLAADWSGDAVAKVGRIVDDGGDWLPSVVWETLPPDASECAVPLALQIALIDVGVVRGFRS